MRLPLLQSRITAWANRSPDEAALVLGSQTATYAQLDEWSNQFARLLKFVGCKKGDRVCLLMPKSIAAIVAILGSLKADCIYVPMDTSSPAIRLAGMIEVCEAKCLIVAAASTARAIEILAQLHRPVVVGCLDPSNQDLSDLSCAFMWNDLAAHSRAGLAYDNDCSDAAHILFTSGSTGVPKGVVITHENVGHYIEWVIRYFGYQKGDRISGHPPLIFDLSTMDIFATLSSGATLYPLTPEMSLLPNKLADFIRSTELTQWFSVPSLLNYMAKFDVVRPNDFPAMRRLLWCGEAFPTPALIYWMKRLPHVGFTNLYGPTETTIASSYYTLPECPRGEGSHVPIGTACEGEELLVLDDELVPVSPGAIGNLFISGVGLSPGYWRDPIKTAAAFVSDPARPGERIYRTGDLASVGTDSLIYLHGRSDSQIKSRGYRIELGEIERALYQIEGLKESAVVALDFGGFEGPAICCAYSVKEGNELGAPQIRKLLGNLVPVYMLPAHWLPLPALPQNANGKIDKVKIREQFQKNRAEASGQ